MSLTFNQKLEITKLNREGMSERPKARPLVQVSKVVNAKEKLLKEMKSATSVNRRIVRKQNSLIADMENVLVV